VCEVPLLADVMGGGRMKGKVMIAEGRGTYKHILFKKKEKILQL
jgi:hypothetical protein